MTSKRRREDAFSAPKFFKIITDLTPHNLRIPAEFMKRHGRSLGNRVYLKVPSTTVSWEVELTQFNAETLLQKGWKEFSERYSLGFGHFLMFEYNGNSEFNVLIFDRTASEINYPDFELESEPSGTESDDDSIMVLEHLSSRKRKAKNDQDSDSQRRKKSYLPERVPVAKETSVSYQKALDFASSCSNPFFISLMQPCYINSARFGLEIPSSFAMENLPCQLSTTATLGIKNDDKKVWPIKLHCNNHRARLSRGWKNFVMDNGLRVGDACLFEFEVGSHFHWNVNIFKVEGSGTKSGRVQKTEEKETSMAYQKAIDFTAGHTFHNPFFISVMQPSYINTARNGLPIPISFVKGNLTCESSSATVQIKNGEKKAWTIKLWCYFKRAKLSSGWKYFVKDNGLKVGDVCLFEVGNHFHWNVVIFKS